MDVPCDNNVLDRIIIVRGTTLPARRRLTESHGLLNCSIPPHSLQNKCMTYIFFEFDTHCLKMAAKIGSVTGNFSCRGL